MLLGIDHIVIACHDPDAAAALIASEAGLTAGGGGRHPRFGTFNRLIWLGDAYLELMGVEDTELARGRGIGAATLALLEQGAEGFASFAVASDALGRDVAAFRAAGAPYAQAKPGERERPDGEVVRWATALPDRVGADGLPFLIEHRYEGAEWGPEARAARAAVIQPFGGTARLARLELALDDPAAAAARYRANLGLSVLRETDAAVDLQIGPHVLRLVRQTAGTPAAAIVITASAGLPLTVDILGCRVRRELLENATGTP